MNDAYRTPADNGPEHKPKHRVKLRKSCPVCGSGHHIQALRYCLGGWWIFGCSTHGPHLHQKCGRCGAGWKADAVEFEPVVDPEGTGAL